MSSTKFCYLAAAFLFSLNTILQAQQVAIIEHALPPALLTGPAGITTGPDGALWFTDYGSIGRITTEGVVTI